jgi:hypothetical protein
MQRRVAIMTQPKFTEVLRVTYRAAWLVAVTEEHDGEPGKAHLWVRMWSPRERVRREYVGVYDAPFEWGKADVQAVSRALDNVQDETNTAVAAALIKRFWAAPK